jgi:hypothetical protein
MAKLDVVRALAAQTTVTEDAKACGRSSEGMAARRRQLRVRYNLETVYVHA